MTTVRYLDNLWVVILFCKLHSLLLYKPKTVPILFISVKIMPSHDVYIPTGSWLNMTCEVLPEYCEQSPLNLTLYKNVMKVPSTYIQHSESKCMMMLHLHKPHVTVDDTGFYRCLHPNWSHSSTPAVHITVGGKMHSIYWRIFSKFPRHSLYMETIA